MNVKAVILAAGQGTRMHSVIPKVLHPLLGQPLLKYSIEAAQRVTGSKPVVVVGYGAVEIEHTFGDIAYFALQEPQLGTAHAVRQAESLLREKANLILVTYGDMPLLTTGTLTRLVQAQEIHTGPVSILTLVAEDPRGFGRIVRDKQGRIQAIIEEAQATPDQLTINELNAGVYCFASDWLWEALCRVPLSQKGEYYLTDVAGIALKEGHSVQALTLDDPQEAIGINTRVHLAEAEGYLRSQINLNWMLSGITLIDPSRTYIEAGVTIGQDTVIWPNTYLQGITSVGEGCTLGPNTIIHDSCVGRNCRVFESTVEHATIEDDVDIGPFGHLRKDAHLARGVHMGNFGEVKSSYLGPGTKMGHFSYIGDAKIGSNVNIGAGTITCNYDGKKKNLTEIETGAFLGSDTMLVAPVKLGEGARTGAGAVVTKDVPPYTLAVGVPARMIKKLVKSD
jgi:bifunctional UDP-N-acetylglucosamine pyrophosphorylase/glucosamine-1-phosphate N-acetyltransferase